MMSVLSPNSAITQVSVFVPSVFIWRVLLVMAKQVASAVECARIFELTTSGCRVGAYNGRVEVNQVTVVCCASLRRADSVGIMACRAGNRLPQVLFVLREAFIVQDAVAAMAFVAQFVRIAALLCKVRCFIS